MSNFIENWTDVCCQPESVKSTRTAMLCVIGTVALLGTLCNLFNMSTFSYLLIFKNRIRRKFGQDFSMIVEDPVFYFFFNLSLCDFLYCTTGLPTYWGVYYYGYFPASDVLCRFSAFFRNTVGRWIKIMIFL